MLIAVVIAVCAYSAIGLFEANRWVNHTYRVISTISRCEASLEETETALRGYLLTAEPIFLATQGRRFAEFSDHMHSLKTLVDDNPVQLHNLDQLQLQANMLKASSDRLLSAFKLEGARTDTVVSLMRQRKTIMRAARAAAKVAYEEEDRLLRDRDASLSKMQIVTWSAVGMLAAIAIVFLTNTFRATRTYVRIEEQNKKEMSELNRELAKAKDALTAALSEVTDVAREAQEARTRLSAVVNSMAEGLYQLDRNGDLVYMNPAAEAILGYSQEGVLGRNMHELIHNKKENGSPSAAADCPLLKVITDGVTTESNNDVFVRHGGELVPVQYFSAPLIVDGEIQGAVVSFQDVTERRASDLRLREFYATLSHELRTPLSSILASLVMIDNRMMGDLPPKATKLISIARVECDRIVRMVNDILDLSKIEAGMFELHKEIVAPASLVERAMATQGGLAHQNNISLKLQVDTDDAVVCDTDRIQQVLNNLISNAIKFSKPESVVQILVERAPSSQVRIAITDEGRGIAKDQIYKLFQRFQRIEDTSSTNKPAGTGLGLAICKALVEQHGGVIGVESVLDKGSTFWLSLPRAEETSAPAASEDAE